MKYYLVALFDNESHEAMESIQKNVCRKYKLSKNTPILHITLEAVEDPDFEKLYRVICDILKPYKKFKIETTGVLCSEPPYKSVNLKIENKGYIIRLARTINDTLRLHGFNVKENADNFNLHVSLGSTNYPNKEWSNKEYVAASLNTKSQTPYWLAKVDRIELWKATNNKKDMLVKSFPLKDY
ncbi:2'-5' RNA ligase family protein [Clostridium omnivorum]|uniref:2'-5' RNA ligase n=1 Tax=Clostridium omnivorum TaxID=1604902 RepID=A0ABQ5N5C1_9CLOT|nr:2'-5' RNA ligase family protein [Clostridium sp. E14]GLC30324.1 hypothetical protein bsdE14_17340 [Clostridium sp. E14]